MAGPWERYSATKPQVSVEPTDGPWARYRAPKQPTAETRPEPSYSPTEGMSTGEKLRAGIGSGMARMARGATNLVLPDVVTPEWASDESIAEAKRLEKPLLETGAGQGGQLIGEIAATLPAGTAVRGAQAAMLASRAPAFLARALAGRLAGAGAEGAISGAVSADPGNRGEGALEGAAISGLMDRGGAVLGRALKGIVKRTPEAEKLEQIADLHGADVRLPLARAASDEGYVSPLVKFVYDKVLPNMPGSENALKRQGDRAQAQFREIAMKEAAPGGAGSSSPGFSGGLPLTTTKAPGAGMDVRTSMKDIQEAFEREYADTVKSYAFNQPSTTDFAQRLVKQFPNIDQEALDTAVGTFDKLNNRYARGGVLDGDNLIRFKTELANLGRGNSNDRIGQSLYQAQEFLDDVVRSELRQGNNPVNLRDLQRYEDLAQPYRNFLRVQKAAARSKNPEGQFTPQELSRSVKTLANDRELAKGTAPMQELGSLGERTVGIPTHNPSWYERAATLAAMGGLGALGGPLGVGAAMGGARVAASPKVQEALMGTTDSQRALVRALRRHAGATRRIGSAARGGAAAEVAQDE